MNEFVFKTQLASSWFMCGLIWLIQIVHYPLFAKVHSDNFVTYHSLHSKYITYIVLPVMLIELLSLVTIYLGENHFLKLDIYVLSSLLFIVWATTAFLSVPAHNELQNGFEVRAYQKLVNTNWIRTIAWTAKSIYLLKFIKV